MTADRIKVVIAEDQRMVLGALAALLSLEDDIEVVAQAGDGTAALAMVREHRPDVLITDVEMPGMSGLDVARLLQGHTQDASHRPHEFRSRRLFASCARGGRERLRAESAAGQ